MVFPLRISFRILSTFTNLRLLCQAHRILEKLREVRRGMYQIHSPGTGEIRYQAKGMNTAQQNAGQFPLRAFQAASPQSMDMLGGRKNARLLPPAKIKTSGQAGGSDWNQDDGDFAERRPGRPVNRRHSSGQASAHFPQRMHSGEREISRRDSSTGQAFSQAPQPTHRSWSH